MTIDQLNEAETPGPSPHAAGQRDQARPASGAAASSRDTTTLDVALPATPGDTPRADAGVAATLRRLDDRLEETIRLLAHQTELADRLHAETLRLRRGELHSALLPLVRDLLRLRDDLSRVMLAAGEAPSPGDLRIVDEALAETLRRNGINAVAPQPGAVFDIKQHAVAGVVATSDVVLDRTVSEVVRPGYAWDDGTPIRVADVRVYKLSSSNSVAATPTDSIERGT